MTKKEIVYLCTMNEERSFRESMKWIDELNIAIEFEVYASSDADRATAKDIMRSVLSRYNKRWDLLPHQHRFVRELLREYSM